MALKSSQRRFLVKSAHNLQPLVMIGSNGLTDAVEKQTEQMLEQHELIKVKFQDFKSSRKELTNELSKNVDAEIVRLIGNVAILFRVARVPGNRKINLPS